MSIPYVVDGETDLDSALFNPIIDRANGLADGSVPIALGGITDALGEWNPGPSDGPIGHMRATRRSILDFGGLGNGDHDNWEAWQYAQEEMGSLGGGVLEFPDGHFYIGQRETSNGLYTALSVNYNDQWIRGQGAKTRIVTDQDAFAIWVHGAATNGRGFVDGYPENLYENYTTYEMEPAARGDTSITLTTPADAGAFPVGARVRIYTGQTIAAPSTNEPDAETNVVLAADTDTGIVRLAHPLRKPYQQEYFISGTSGYTSRSVTANPAPWGIQNIDDAILKNCWITDLTLESTTVNSLIRGDQVENFHLERCILKSRASVESMSNIYGGRIMHNRLYIEDGGSSLSPLTASTGSSDVVVGYNDIFADTAEACQINEGCSNVLWIGNGHYIGAQATDAPAVQVGGRGRDIRIVLNTFQGAGNNSVITVSSPYDTDLVETSGIIALNMFSGGNWERPILIQCPGWLEYGNHFAPKSGTGTYQLYDYQYGSGQPQQRKVLQAWLDKDHQTVTLGKLPINAYVLGVYIQAYVGFDSDGTDTVSIGTDDNTTRFSNAVDVSTAGIKSPTAASTGFRSANYIVKAYYVNGGTEPTQGKVLAMIEYVIAPTNP